MSSSAVLPLPRKPLAACVATIFALAAPLSYANTFVTNCNDSGTGSLRDAVSSAVEGDTVDATTLTTSSPGCSASKITLRTGDIVVTQNYLAINGPGMNKLNVTAKYSGGPPGSNHQYHNRIFTHNGTGTLSINNLSMSKGYLVSSAGTVKGGCLYSKGNVILSHAGVYLCGAHTTSGLAYGGGIYTKGSLTVDYGNVVFNSADGGSTGASSGGGVMSQGSFFSQYSRITANSASNAATTVGTAGGGWTQGPVAFIRNTTIANNRAGGNVGGLVIFNSTGTATLLNSTISGNTAGGVVGGTYTRVQTVHAYNSTIAFNKAGGGNSTQAAGWQLAGPAGATAMLQSMLVANNTYGSPGNKSDLGGFAIPTISGSNNLITTSSASLPADTIVGKCPLLGPLQLNGGPTETHALFSHSPAIDVGNNKFNTVGTSFDQRGSPYVRVSGPPGSMTPRADIGAYEVNQADIVFNSSFEGCP